MTNLIVIHKQLFTLHLIILLFISTTTTTTKAFIFSDWFQSTTPTSLTIHDYYFTPWSNWSDCSEQTCRQVRYRKCNISDSISHYTDYDKFLGFNYANEEKRNCIYKYIVERRRCNCSSIMRQRYYDWYGYMDSADHDKIVMDAQSYSNFSDWTKCDRQNCFQYRSRICEHPQPESWTYRVQCPFTMIEEQRKCYESKECRDYWKYRTRSPKPPKSNKFPKQCGVQQKPNNKPLSLRVIGGNEAKRHHWPWHVAILSNAASGFVKTHIQCGGTLIHSQWVLTAAHCLSFVGLKGLPKGNLISLLSRQSKPIWEEFGPQSVVSPLWVRAGDYDTYETDSYEEDFAVSHIAIHPHFHRDGEVPFYDLALLRLHKEVNISRGIDISCLPQVKNYDSFDNATCYAVGWGATEKTKPITNQWIYQTFQKSLKYLPNSSTSKSFSSSSSSSTSTNGDNLNSRFLQEVHVPIVPLSECTNDLSTDNLVKATHICAGEPGRDTCQGDSGGGLYCFDRIMKRWRVAGITSFGSGCGLHRSVYAKVDQEWIHKMISE